MKKETASLFGKSKAQTMLEAGIERERRRCYKLVALAILREPNQRTRMILKNVLKHIKNGSPSLPDA